MTFNPNLNGPLLEEYERRWREDPASLDPEWHTFFLGFEFGSHELDRSQIEAQIAVLRLVFAHRDLGHRSAHLDPLSPPPEIDPELRPERHGLTEAHMERVFGTTFVGLPTCTLRTLLAALRATYCGTIGYEYMHIQDPSIRSWLQERIEPRRSRPNFSREQKISILRSLHEAETFETFLHRRFVNQKRFSLEGAETLIPLLDAFLERSPEAGIDEYVIGMAHRGRLNVLANILNKPYSEIFAEFEDYFHDEASEGDGDVKYHLGFSADLNIRGHPLHLSLTPNPSHLEAVNPVVLGRVRAKQDYFGDRERRRGVAILIHGDAAFVGQGSVCETLNLVKLEGYATGGVLHVIVNNQIGFTTLPSDARSTRYATDMAKMIQAPVFHVNADDPEAVVFVAELALEFRQTFGNDVIIDMYCFRRRGHNESDEPSFTQPLLYRRIAEHPTTSRVYSEHLIRQGDLTEEESQAIAREYMEKLDAAQRGLKTQPPRTRGMPRFGRRWEGYSAGGGPEKVKTAVTYGDLVQVGRAITRVPPDFTPHRKLWDPTPKSREAAPETKTFLQRQIDMIEGRDRVDWGFAEALAFGTLLVEGTPVRLSGQDSRRGTFTQRHAVWVDQNDGRRYVPLNHIAPEQATFQVYDSPLSEFAVLGFEFGYSMDDPETLVIWEAQFGDFANGAQVIIDQFVSSSYSKWQRASGLVMLLPHGYEGQGPEHSSARLERFLQLCAEDNIQVCNATTPAQYFHLLRRQMLRRFRKPLVVMTPKSLLRHPLCRSSLTEFTEGEFREVLDDPRAEPGKVHRVILCSGKLYYDFFFDVTERDPIRANRLVPPEIAIVRVEQLYPFPEEQLRSIQRRYADASEWIWAQEEPQNMGAWSFIEPRLRSLGLTVEYVGRDASASPATGSYKIHVREQREIVEAALYGTAPYLVVAVPSHSAARAVPDSSLAARSSS
jgi:2-oxoglutarate dehydrogenase E1 component